MWVYRLGGSIAKGFKSGGRDVKKGQVLNPNGRPPLPDHLKMTIKLTHLRDFTRNRIIEMISKMFLHTPEQLTEVFNHPETTALEKAFIKIMHEAIRKGDEKKLQFLLDRAFGKVKERVEVSADAHTQLIALIKKRERELEEYDDYEAE